MMDKENYIYICIYTMDTYIHNTHTYTHMQYICSEILFSLKIEKKKFFHLQQDEPEGHYAKWNKPNIEGQIF